jgi:hypothetical protein
MLKFFANEADFIGFIQLQYILSNRLIAEAHHQHGTPQDASGRNFVSET